MARDLAETMGVEPEFVKTSWKTLMDDYTAGTCDVAVGGISLNPERAEQVYFTVPTQEDGKTPITRCENVEKYDTVAEINQPGVRSIFPEGGTNEKFAREHYPVKSRVVDAPIAVKRPVAG
ncbi:transporter substrate-binding domain-containing protein [Micrococcus luteus]|uniref:transporter substrate-binding domain-containing protein n=1 Tax=Micrococcus luteus TaxID=1270 RepID=UPI00215288EE|nr:transporter substrate-binding domain-containing protein [Micrococcus luteus]